MKRYLIRPEWFGGIAYDRHQYEYRFLDHAVMRAIQQGHHSCGTTDLALMWRDGLPEFEFLPAPVQQLAGVLSAPLQLYLDITTACQLRCNHCYNCSGDHGRSDMPLNVVQRLADEAASSGVFKISLGGGEPLLHPQWPDAILAFKHHDIDVSLSTNGILLTDTSVARSLAAMSMRSITVSMDGYDEPSFDSIRGHGTFARVVAGIRALRHVHKGRLSLRATLLKPVCNHPEAVVALAEDLGADVVKFKAAQPYGRILSHPDLLPSMDEYHRAVTSIADTMASSRIRIALPGQFMASIHHQNNVVNRYIPLTANGCPPYKNTFGCSGGKIGAYITVGGQVTPCISMGREFLEESIYTRSLTDIWLNGASFVRMRGLPPDPICARCQLLQSCKGGCRARAFAAGASPSAPDPFCPNPGRYSTQ